MSWFKKRCKHSHLERNIMGNWECQECHLVMDNETAVKILSKIYGIK